MKLVCLVALAALSLCDGARILSIQPNSAVSHSIVMVPLFEELAARGHHVTVYSSYPHHPPLKNLTDIDLSHVLPPIINYFGFDFIKETMPNKFQTPIFMAILDLSFCELILSSDPIQKLIKSNAQFDLVFVEVFAADCFVPIAHRFGAPLIAFTTSNVLPWAAERVGLPDNPSYIPNYLVDFAPSMTFFERVYNMAVLMSAKLLHRYYTLPRSQALVNKYIGDSLPPLYDLIQNTSMMFVNSHITLFNSRPFPPNVVELGGIHIRNASKPIPQDLQRILDESPQGVIVASFGSLVKVSSIPPHVIEMFMKAFSTLSQTVIFKYENEFSKVPPNVILRKWLPQRELIEHKNVHALLAHGGLASTIETVYFGKPLIGVPFFADQYLNVKSVVRRGAGIMLDLESISQSNIETAIQEVLNNPKYTENMRSLSRQFRDRPMTALQTAVYWTEYVIRHQGAPHLRPASVSLPFYQYLLLDLIGLLLLPLLLLFYIIYFLFFKAVEVSPKDYRNYELKEKNN